MNWTSRLHWPFRFIIALVLIKYGLDKVCWNQFQESGFYLQSLPLGEIPEDVLFWHVMSRAPSITWAVGAMEIAMAILLFIPRLHVMTARVTALLWLILLWVDLEFQLGLETWLLSLFLFNLYLVFTDWSGLDEVRSKKAGLLPLAAIVLCTLPYLRKEPQISSWVGVWKNISDNSAIHTCYIEKEGFMICRDTLGHIHSFPVLVDDPGQTLFARQSKLNQSVARKDRCLTGEVLGEPFYALQVINPSTQSLGQSQ